ncbi:14-3-3-like protein GF14-12 [Ipomoea triloba]|uniref:14-3-3-like protein GF14-12 n=1 Tax=Ipomoea triloba TaxID=35885 RepID=UPI00125E1632|nr:14-3-3-like protein GF14-12 [Ipomoea triloba]
MAVPINREYFLYLCKLAEQAQDYNEIFELMGDTVGVLDSELTREEIRLLSLAYSKVTGPLRAAWLVAYNNETLETDEQKQTLAKGYREKLGDKLSKLCDKLEGMLDSISPYTTSSDAKLCYYKLSSDHFRSLSEFHVGPDKQKVDMDAEVMYVNAQAHAEAVSPADPVRLGLAFNYSVFQYENLKSPVAAIETANKAFDNAMASIDTLEMLGEESTHVLGMLHDNLTLWNAA